MTVEVVRDFTPAERVIRFRIRGETFEAAPDLPAMVAIQLAELAEKKDESESQGKVFADMFRLLLLPESAERFIERMSDLQRPISIRMINDIMPWLMEEYGLRPTTAPSDSSGGSGNQGGGTNLTGNALVPAVLTSDNSLSTVS
jgi:hypothetical protein